MHQGCGARQTQAVGAESPPPQLLADAVCQASLEVPRALRGKVLALLTLHQPFR